jgi:purine-binding chemotaxis protein CheW
VKSFDRHAASNGPTARPAEASYLRLRLGQEQYALPLADVAVVIVREELRVVPGSGEALLGVVNRRGKVLPVFDLACALSLGSAGATTRVVVVEDGDRVAGLAVKGVSGIGPLPTLEETSSAVLRGVTVVDGARIGVLDLVALLDELQESATS